MKNVFSGFDAKVLAEAFGVTEETAVKLQTVSTATGDLVAIATKLVQVQLV